MKASDLFLRCLEQEGVEYIFGVPGEENADLMISLLNSSIQFITCRHEQTASFMADMYGRLTGKPGVCLATLGPGATNLITGVANANMDHVPLIALIGQASTHRLHKESHQNMDSISMYKPVSKWVTSVHQADTIPEVIRKAMKIAVANKPGAVVIELPEDIAKCDTDATPLPMSEKIGLEAVNPRLLNDALKLIAMSKKPLVIIGAGCTRANSDIPLTKFMDATHIHGAVTFMGKGVLSAKDPQSLFCVGLGMKDIALKAFDQADLIIAIGYDLVEWSPDHWNPNCDKTIIHIDTLEAEVDRFYMPTLELVGSINEILSALNTQLTDKQKKDPHLFEALRAELRKEVTEFQRDEGFPVKPQRILDDLRAALRAEDILISDVGAHKMWVARQYPAYHSKTCFIYNGFCSMGGSMPGAIVAKMLHPEKRVVTVCGDGGFMMSIQALATAVELKQPIVVVLWEDDAYGLIEWKQEAAYHQSSHIKLVNPDLAHLAEAFGCAAYKVKQPDELVSLLKKAFEEKTKPTVIVVPVDYRENMKLTQRLGELLSH